MAHQTRSSKQTAGNKFIAFMWYIWLSHARGEAFNFVCSPHAGPDHADRHAPQHYAVLSSHVLRWKDLHVSSTVHRYLQEIRICVPNHVRITHNVLCLPTPPHAMIMHTTHALTGVTNIEFSVLHMTLPNASTAQRCEVTVVRVDLVHWQERLMVFHGRAMREIHTSVPFDLGMRSREL